MGQEAYKKTFPNSVWPGFVASGPPLALGFNGQVQVHPDNAVTGAQADNRTNFTLQNVIGEAHLWAGGSYDDKITYWGEVTFATDGTIDIEKAQIIINDWLGPKHAVNTIVGRGVANVSSFGPHSAYVADALIPSVPVTGLLGAQGDSFNIGDNYDFVEMNGVIGGRFIYNVGLSAGQHIDVRPTENFYGHIGFKLGGMRMDGEGTAGPTDAQHPWAETAVTLDAFAYKSNSHFTPASGGPTQMDPALTLGAGLRAQWGSLELNTGVYTESHNNAQDAALVAAGTAPTTQASAVSQYNELSYVVFPWLVPALRVEYTNLSADGSPTLSDLRVMPGVAALVRPNIKLVLVGLLESTNGAPPGGWGAVNGGFVSGQAAPVSGRATEVEAIQLYVGTAF